ncbi:MAG: flap endonuclease Xni [Desulfomonilia bacterium]
MAIRALLIDALNLIRRVYAAQPGPDGSERVNSARESSAQSLSRALKECSPSHAMCIFEGQGTSWRHRLYDQYKAGRTPMPACLQDDLPEFEHRFSSLGVGSIVRGGLEADDIIATIAMKISRQGGDVIILSTDKIFFQLITEHIHVRDHYQRKTLDRQFVTTKYQVSPEQFVDYLSLTGDSTSHIPGVPSIGPKTAVKLIAIYGNLDNILLHARHIGGACTRKLLVHSDLARLSQTLFTLKTDLDLGLNLQSFRYTEQA